MYDTKIFVGLTQRRGRRPLFLTDRCIRSRPALSLSQCFQLIKAEGWWLGTREGTNMFFLLDKPSPMVAPAHGRWLILLWWKHVLLGPSSMPSLSISTELGFFWFLYILRQWYLVLVMLFRHCVFDCIILFRLLTSAKKTFKCLSAQIKDPWIYAVRIVKLVSRDDNGSWLLFKSCWSFCLSR